MCGRLGNAWGRHAGVTWRLRLCGLSQDSSHTCCSGASCGAAVPDLPVVKASLGEALSLLQEEGSGVTLSERVLGRMARPWASAG